jgi:hypothetical protein
LITGAADDDLLGHFDLFGDGRFVWIRDALNVALFTSFTSVTAALSTPQ